MSSRFRSVSNRNVISGDEAREIKQMSRLCWVNSGVYECLLFKSSNGYIEKL